MNRILSIDSLQQARNELAKIKVSSQGIDVMSPKCLGLNIKLSNVHIGAANILKQEMLSIGGDAAVARGVVNGVEKCSDVILLGNADKIKKLIKKLNYQTIFGLPKIQEDLSRFLKITLQDSLDSLMIGEKSLNLSTLKIMGILNITPDSFSDGAKFFEVDTAVNHALQMIEDGADIIDIGGESTRPGSKKVGLAEELDRVVPIIRKIREKSDIPISIDTCKAEVAEQGLAVGADMVNDISALRFDSKMTNVLKNHPHVPLILMHMQGTPKTMQQSPVYNDVIEDILTFFESRLNYCLANDIAISRIILDPGIGFGKKQQDNLEILNRLNEFKCFGVPVMLGASRKSFINNIYKALPDDRLEGSLAAAAIAYKSGVSVIRVHDVRAHKRFLQVLESV